MTSFWVYILWCGDGSYYVGQTDDLERRFAEHQEGAHEGYTYARLPVRLVFATEFPSRGDAIIRERQIKKWSRAKKAALIAGNWALLSRLAWGTDRLIEVARDRPSTPLGMNGVGSE